MARVETWRRFVLVATVALVVCSKSPEDFGSEAHKNACGYLHFLGSSLSDSLDAATLREYEVARAHLSRVEGTDPPDELTASDREFLDAYREDVTFALGRISRGESGPRIAGSCA